MRLHGASLTSLALAVCFLLACSEPRTVQYYDLLDSPHPFSPATRISFSVPSCMPVRIDVYNVYGQLIGTPFDTIACKLTEMDLSGPVTRTESTSGQIDTVWCGFDAVAPGIYFYRLACAKDTVTKKLIILR